MILFLLKVQFFGMLIAPSTGGIFWALALLAGVILFMGLFNWGSTCWEGTTITFKTMSTCFDLLVFFFWFYSQKYRLFGPMIHFRSINGMLFWKWSFRDWKLKLVIAKVPISTALLFLYMYKCELKDKSSPIRSSDESLWFGF